MVIQKKVSFIIALLILHLAAFAQAENERYPMQASGIVRSHKVSQSDFIPLYDLKVGGIQPSARIKVKLMNMVVKLLVSYLKEVRM